MAKVMEERRQERIERLGSMNDVEVPKPRFNFTKLVDNYKLTGKIDI